MGPKATQHQAPARYYDGVQPRPASGTVYLYGQKLIFQTESGKSLSWNFRQVASSEIVGGEVHVEIREAPHPAPMGLLIIADPAFDRALDDTRLMVTTSANETIQLHMKRIGVAGLIVLVAIALPIGYFAVTEGAEAGHCR